MLHHSRVGIGRAHAFYAAFGGFQLGVLLGIALFDTGQFGPSFASLQRAVEFDPENSEVRVKLGTIYLLRGMREEAREEAGAVLDRDALAVYADTATSAGEIDGAVRRLENARAEHEGRAKFHLALGSLHFRKRDVDTAESHFQEAARREPDSPDAHLALGTFYLAKRDLDSAEAEFNKAAEAAPVRSATQIRVVDFYRLVGAKGPYYLGGGCEGSYAAFEIALQLQKRGHEVACLTLGAYSAGYQRFRQPGRSTFMRGGRSTRIARLWCRIGSATREESWRRL